MSSFYSSVPILMIIGYPVLEIWCVMDVIVLHFGQLFALPPPALTAQKIKKHMDISPFYKSVPKIMIIGYTVLPEIWHVMDEIVIFHFELFFALLPPNSLKNENFKKMKKNPGIIIILHK